MNANEIHSELDIRHTFLGFAVRLSAAGLVFFSVLLPTGSVAGIPIKHFLYISFVAVLLVAWGRSNSRISLGVASLLFFSAIYTFGYMLLGLIRGVSWPTYIFSEGVGFFTTISLVLLAWICKSQQWVSGRGFLIYAFYGSLAFSLIKSTAAILVSVGVISYVRLYSFVSDVFGYKFVSGLMFGGLVRVNFIIYDFFVLFMMVLLLVRPSVFDVIPKFVRVLFVFSALVCVFFAYSRLLFAVLFSLMLFLFVFKFGWRERVCAVAVAMVFSVSLYAWIEGTYQDRFKSKGAEESDRVRIEQVEALLDTWKDTPWIGGGFGYFSREYVRDPGAPFSYEVQWVGFLAKLGAVGIIFPLSLIAMILWVAAKRIAVPEVLFVASVFVVFLLGGLTNQYLITSGAAVFYLCALIFFDLFSVRDSGSSAGNHGS